VPRKTAIRRKKSTSVWDAWPYWVTNHPRFEYCVLDGRKEDAALLLMAGMYFLLQPIPLHQRDAFIDELKADPNALDRLLTAVDDFLDAQKA
jgi:hypothetical protein